MTGSSAGNDTLESMELSSGRDDDDLRANLGHGGTPHKGDSKTATKRIRRKALLLRLLFLFVVSGVVGYTYIVVSTITILENNPRLIIQQSFNSRGGTSTFIVGETLLTPNQRIENLGTIRQRSVRQNHENVLEFLSAIAQNNPPDIFANLINPTVEQSLLEKTSVGNLPTVSDDGRTSLITYARPFNEGTGLNEVSIIINGLGTSLSLAEAAIQLKPEVSLALSPYTERIEELVISARKAGHEVFLELPMEPHDFPVRDPGPFALRKDFTLVENISQLQWILSRVQGYVGLINFQGEAMLEDDIFVSTVLPVILRRGLMFLEKTPDSAKVTPDSTINPVVKQVVEEQGHYYTSIDVSIDINDDEISFEEKLAHALEISRQTGRVTIAVSPFPLLLMKLALWMAELPEDEFVLTPLSSRAQQHEARRLGLAG